MHNYKFGVTPTELKEARKLIIQDIKSNNKVDNPICNMTLQDYFDIIKECVLGSCDENGIITDPYTGHWYSETKQKDMRKLSSIEVAKAWMDGRGLFDEHFNSQLWGDEEHQGNWDNIGQHEQNKWYHEDRLNDPLWFRECIFVIGHAGHPTEMVTCGNFNPYEYEPNKWCMRFGTFSRSSYYMLKGYLYMKKKGLPVFIDGAKEYLTIKQKEKLKLGGYIK